MNLQKNLPFFILLSLAFMFGLFGVFYYKQLFNDGAYWAYDIINSRFFHVERQYFRYTTLLLQLPSLITTKLNLAPSIPTFLFCFSYYIYPFIGLSVLTFKLKNHPRRSLIILPVLTFFLCIIPGWAFSVAVAPESIVIFWFLFCYIIVTEKPSFFIILLFSVCLLFSYEPAIVFYPLSAYILWREGKISRPVIILLLILIALQVLNFFIFIVPFNYHSHFKNNWMYGIKSPLLLVTPAVLLTYASIFLKGKFQNFILIIGLCLATYAATLALSRPEDELWGQSYFDRTWAIPSAWLILGLGYEFLRRHHFKLSTKFAWIFALLCVPSLMFEARMNLSHFETSSRIRGMVKEKKGCHVLTDLEWDLLNGESFIPTWSFAFLSVLYNGSYQVEVLLFPLIKNNDGTIIENDQCSLTESDIFFFKDQHSSYGLYTKANFDFGPVINRLPKSEELPD